MDDNLEARVNHVMKYIISNWPQIKPYIPDEIRQFDHGFGKGTGLCTQPELIGERWISSVGAKKFKEANVPEGFHCVGIQNRGTSEYLFIMWYKDGRKFWFYDQYVVFVGAGFPASQKRTKERIKSAFQLWKSTEEDVLYSGIEDLFY
jgi:hypothetical protein